MSGCRFLVTGDVQGVGFRRWVQRVASRLGLTGHVRNLPDGRVEVIAWGMAGTIAELGRMLAIGPPAANVTKVDKTEILDEDNAPSGFNIVR